MGLMDILRQYTDASANPDTAREHFDQVLGAAPPVIVGQGFGDAPTNES